MSKYVESYWAEELPNGVIHLLINTSERWLAYQVLNDISFLITSTEEEAENWGDPTCILEVPEFLSNIEEGMYIRTSMQEKDQISIYWIPYFYKDRKNSKKIIMNTVRTLYQFCNHCGTERNFDYDKLVCTKCGEKCKNGK